MMPLFVYFDHLEPRIELRHALQKAYVLPTERRRTITELRRTLTELRHTLTELYRTLYCTKVKPVVTDS